MKVALIFALFVAFLFCVVGFEAYSTPILARSAVAVLFGVAVWLVAKMPRKSSATPSA